MSIAEDKAAGTLYEFQLSVLLDAKLTLDNCIRAIDTITPGVSHTRCEYYHFRSICLNN